MIRDAHLIAIDRKIKRYRAEKRAGLVILGIVALTAVCAVMLHLDATLRNFGVGGNLGV
jgi:hypothetical protein